VALNHGGRDGSSPMRRAERPLRPRVRSSLFLLPAWFSPSSSMRAAFHRLRGVRLGRDVEIGYFVVFDNLYPEKIVVEDGATITAHCAILAHDESAAYARDGEEIVRETRIKAKAFIGVHSVVMPGVVVGERAIVGAGSVVTRSVPDGVTVAGVPARDISRKPTG